LLVRILLRHSYVISMPGADSPRPGRKL
jgi:hypothetical protein